jgi:hypothetical protein
MRAGEKCRRGVGLKEQTGSEGKNLRDAKPQESNGSVFCAKPDLRKRLFEGKKALKSRVPSVIPAGTAALKGKRANGLETGPALQREKHSEGENPRNA